MLFQKKINAAVISSDQAFNCHNMEFSFERNCVLCWWESEALKQIINHKFNKVLVN